MDYIKDVVALSELREKQAENGNLKAIAWVIGVVVVLAIIVFWFRKGHDDHKCRGEQKGSIKFLEKEVERQGEKVYGMYGNMSKLNAEFHLANKYANEQFETLNARCFPSGYLGCQEREGCHPHHHHKGKVTQTTPLTPGTPVVQMNEVIC